MYKTILVPIDLGQREKSGPMIDIARKLVDKGGRIILVNVVEEIPSYIVAQLPGGLLEKARARALDELKAIAAAAAIEPDCKVRAGAPYVAILANADEEKADLIIVGSHTPGLQDYLIGSTAARVVRHATCSVLVVR